MNRQKRHAGRAIRRQRRERHQVMGAVATIDWGALGALFTRAMEWLGRVVAAVASAVEVWFVPISTLSPVSTG
ncbi:hypothetical protein MPMin1_gp22 [Microbacterium phage Min1]|uniref:Uncharacterized protein n=1 Tax=Microbacterium phage Min1 TaxID=446529 RepID=A6N1Y0_9CAUD|nr:hypothetical protein MPMin1_gp22 [Microbacterium phage Min1]ABR10452.1 hypothetical protein [Microbacterium phage Min1]